MMISFRRISLCLMLGLTGFISAQNLMPEQNDKEKFGYVDDTGKFVIKPQYNVAFPFDNGRAKVCKGDKWGYIGPDGKAIIAIQYDMIEDFKDGIALVKKGKKYGYIRQDGTFYIKPEYNFIGRPNANGLCWVAKGKTLKESMKGLMRDGKVLVKPSYKGIGIYAKTDTADYTDGRPIIWGENMVPKNNEITKNLSKLSETDVPYFWAVKGIQVVMLDREGKELFKHNAAAMGAPKDGYALLRTYANDKKKGQTYSYEYISVNDKGKKLFKKAMLQHIDSKNIFDGCTPFRNGIAMITNNDQSYLVNTNGMAVSSVYNHMQPAGTSGFIAESNGLYCLTDLQGKELFKPTYELIKPADITGARLFAKDRSGHFGVLKCDGTTIVPFEYEDFADGNDSNLCFKKNSHWGVMDESCNVIVRPQWARVWPSKTGNYMWVKNDSDSKWLPLDIAKDTLTFTEGFDDVGRFDTKGRSYAKKDGKWGAVRFDSVQILPFAFDDIKMVSKAMGYIDERNMETMEPVHAYRFNIMYHPDLKKYKLDQTVPSNMWDY